MSTPAKQTLPKLTLYAHLFNDIQKGIIQSVKVTISSEIIRILDFKIQLTSLLDKMFKSTNIKYLPQTISKTLFSPSLNDTTKIRNFFENKNDIFVNILTEAIPVETNKNSADEQKDIVLKYNTINKYSFYESSSKYIRVLVPIPGIENVKKEDIISNFTETTLEVKVNNALNGNNYRFACLKLEQKIKPELCEVLVKNKDLIIKLRKFNESDNWPALFKQNYIGE